MESFRRLSSSGSDPPVSESWKVEMMESEYASDSKAMVRWIYRA